MTTSRFPVSVSRAQRQRGNEIIEFSLMAAFLVPLFLWVFINGLNLVRFNEGTEINRDIGSLYIKGTDFSTYLPQTIAATIAKGYGLTMNSFTGNQHTNNSGTGNGYVILSQIMFVGATTGHTCQGATPSCVNHNSYVYLQYIDFGNVGLQFNGTTVATKLGGTPASATINTSGLVQNYLTDPNAVATNVPSLMASQLGDGQVAYVVETFFTTPSLGFSGLPGGGIYGRTFF
jgi:hypothetical protein